MRWYTPVLVAAISGSLIACTPAQAPPDDTVAPPAATTGNEPGPAADAPAADDAAMPQVVHYDCEGTPVDATFDGRGQANVAMEGATFVMRTEQAASGAKYSDGAGTVLWTRGADSALLQRPDRPDRLCSLAPIAPA